MIAPLLLLFIVVPIAELYVIIQVGQAIGALPTIAILIADSVLGTWLLRSQGRLTWRRFNAAVAEGRPPAREVLDGALVIFGGAFLITPGFITDVIGLALLLPPSRVLLRRALVRNFTNRAVVRAFGTGGPRGRPHAHYDVEGTGVELDPPRREPR
jgi:UPF0716 protein FxsA